MRSCVERFSDDGLCASSSLFDDRDTSNTKHSRTGSLRRQRNGNSNYNSNDRIRAADESETTAQALDEFEANKQKEDAQLDELSSALSGLLHLSKDMNKELNKQTTTIDSLSNNLDHTNQRIKASNRQIKKDLL